MKIHFLRRAALGVLLLSAGYGNRLAADVVLEWNDLLIRCTSRAAPDPAACVQVRAFAMAHLAMASAIASVRTVSRDAAMRVALERGAVATAARDVLAHAWPANVDDFDALASRQLGALDSTQRSQAERIGRLAAATVLQARERDGWLALAAFGDRSTLSPDSSQAAVNAIARGDPPERSPWLLLTPFALKKVGQFEASPAYIVNHEGEVIVDTTLRRSRLFNSVDRTQPAEVLQNTWSGDPLLMWNRIARASLEAVPVDIATEARVLATLNLALADALIAAQHSRFQLGTWRAITVDRWEELDGKAVLPGDVLVTATDGLNTRSVRHQDGRLLIPPQRDFPSVAATLAGAAQAALAGCWKTDRVAFSIVTAGAASERRSYTCFSDAAREASFVAGLDGRHTREACVSGYNLGAEIGTYVAKRAPTLAR